MQELTTIQNWKMEVPHYYEDQWTAVTDEEPDAGSKCLVLIAPEGRDGYYMLTSLDNLIAIPDVLMFAGATGLKPLMCSMDSGRTTVTLMNPT